METKTPTSNDSLFKNIRTRTELNPKQFDTFKLFINTIKPTFEDFNLVGGAFRSFSNNHKCIVETGFKCFDGMNLNLRDIPSIYKTISEFGKNGTVTFKLKNDWLIIKDAYGEISFLNNDGGLNNKYIYDDDFFAIILKNIDADKLFVNEAVSKKHVCKMKKMFGKLSSNHVTLKITEKNSIEGVLSISGKKPDSPEFQKKLLRPLLIPLDKKYYFEIHKLPWSFNKDDMYLKCYLQKDRKVNAICSTNINDLYVNIYSQTELIENSNENQEF